MPAAPFGEPMLADSCDVVHSLTAVLVDGLVTVVVVVVDEPAAEVVVDVVVELVEVEVEAVVDVDVPGRCRWSVWRPAAVCLAPQPARTIQATTARAETQRLLPVLPEAAMPLSLAPGGLETVEHPTPVPPGSTDSPRSIDNHKIS